MFNVLEECVIMAAGIAIVLIHCHPWRLFVFFVFFLTTVPPKKGGGFLEKLKSTLAL
jgi:hypothetical protein